MVHNIDTLGADLDPALLGLHIDQGATLTFEVITRRIDDRGGGLARVNGLDVARQPEEIRRQINMVSGGETSGYGLLTVRENLWMFTQFYGIPSKQANARIMELLKIVGLEDRANTKSSNLSTGLRQKMNIVRGFMTDPTVLFLDEPTLGLDVSAARDVRRFVRQWVDDDPTRTLLLTTHYMEEASRLCDRLMIMDHGRILVEGRPADLVRDYVGHDIIEVSDPGPALRQFVQSHGLHHEDLGHRLIIYGNDRDELYHEIRDTYCREGCIMRMASLEDVFLKLTGRGLRE